MLDDENFFVSLPTYTAYYMNLHLPNVITKLSYRFNKFSIVYGIRCRRTSMLYVGSTMVPKLRFHNHPVTGKPSNRALQSAIVKYGLHNFVVYVFEIVVFPKGLTSMEQKAYLRAVEQRYIDHFPKNQLYNEINSSS